jgi:hypothetical protein
MNVRCRTYNCMVATTPIWPLCPNRASWELLREPEQMSGFGIDLVRLNFAAPQSSDAVYLLA